MPDFVVRTLLTSSLSKTHDLVSQIRVVATKVQAIWSTDALVNKRGKEMLRGKAYYKRQSRQKTRE